MVHFSCSFGGQQGDDVQTLMRLIGIDITEGWYVGVVASVVDTIYDADVIRWSHADCRVIAYAHIWLLNLVVVAVCSSAPDDNPQRGLSR